MEYHRSKILIRLVNLLLGLVMLSSLLAGCQGQTLPVPEETRPRINPPVQIPTPTASFPQISERNPDVPEDYQPVAETSALRLYVRKASSAIIVEDKRSNQIWHSSPADLKTTKDTTNIWKRQIEVPIQVSYVDSERAQPKNIKPEKIEFDLSPVQDGVQTNYRFTGLNLEASVVYALRNDCLEATIPAASIQEKGENGFVSLDLLAFFGGTRDGEEGYIIFPDGSGALMHFTSPHPQEVQKISSVVYGSDSSGGTIGSSKFSRGIDMPVFGLARKDAAFVGIITQGDFDANVSVARAGKGIAYNHVWTTFLFRRQGRFSITGGQPAWLFQPDMQGGDRQVRYCFLNGDKANYTGMASLYRDYLRTDLGAKRLSEQDGKKQVPLLYASFFMGIERKTWFLADMISMTTFSQAGNILRDLAAAGVSNIDIDLRNWNKGATADTYPRRLPVDDRLGGEKELRALVDQVHQAGQRIYLTDSFFGVSPNAPDIFPYLDAVRGVDGLPFGGADVGYAINPQVSLRRFAARDFAQMMQFGADGVNLRDFGFIALPDKNQNYPLSRENYAASSVQIAQLVKKNFSSATIEGPNIYVLPHVDWMSQVSLDSTHYDLFDETVPFFQIAVHGLVPYSGQAYNLLADGKRMFLRQIEYGARPFFVLTEDNSARLLRTNANDIYSSQYSFWKDEIVRQYHVMEKLAPLTGQFITDHKALAEDVYQTTYEDGTRVIVNYGSAAYSMGAVSVPAQDFAVVGGK